MEYCQELDLACLQRLTRRVSSDFLRKSLRWGGGLSEKRAFALVNGYLHLGVVRRSRRGGPGNRDGVERSLRPATGAGAGAGGSAGRLQQDRTRDQAENHGRQPAPSLATGPDTQSGQAQASDGEPGGVERAATEQGGDGHGAGHGSDAECRSCTSGPGKYDGSGGKDGSGCRHHRRRGALAGSDAGAIAAIRNARSSGAKVDQDCGRVTGVNGGRRGRGTDTEVDDVYLLRKSVGS